MYKFIYTIRDKITGKVKKLCESFFFNYDSCIREEEYYFKHLDHNKFTGHAIINYISR